MNEFNYIVEYNYISNRIYRLYKELLEFYGLQNWWPVITKGKHKNQLEIMIGAILTQNTAWKNVEKAIKNLHKSKLIDINALLNVEIKKLIRVIKVVGYYNQKAKRLKQLALFLKQNPVSMLENLSVENLRRLLLSVKGIGFETADSICLYAFNKPCFIVDAYAKRLFSRLGIISGQNISLNKNIASNNNRSYNKNNNRSYNNIKQLVELCVDQRFKQPSDNKKLMFYKELHALIDEHCKRFCKKKPLCNECFLSDNCSYARNESKYKSLLKQHL